MRCAGRLAAACAAGLLAILAASCALFPMVPSPELGHYALGMTYAEALGVTGDFTGGRKPPWPAWPPTAMRVKPPEGADDMHLVFAGECVAAIEVGYHGACEDRLLEFAAHRYGPVTPNAHGEYLWTDGARDVALMTRHDGRPACEPTCVTSCTLTYRLSHVGQIGGPANTAHGRSACRAMDRRARVRWRDDSLHTVQRHALDELGYLVGAGTRPMLAP